MIDRIKTCPTTLESRGPNQTILRCDLLAGHDGLHHTAPGNWAISDRDWTPTDKVPRITQPPRCSAIRPGTIDRRQCVYLGTHANEHVDELGNEFTVPPSIEPECPTCGEILDLCSDESEAAHELLLHRDTAHPSSTNLLATTPNEPTALAEVDLIERTPASAFLRWKHEADRLDRVADNEARVACLHLLSGRPDMALKRALAFEAAQEATRAFLATSWTVGA